MFYRLSLLILLTISCFLRSNAQKEEIIRYLDSTYYSYYKEYDSLSFDGWYINNYYDMGSRYFIDTNLNCVLEKQIRSQGEVEELMNTLSDTLLFDTLMLTYYDIINDSYKSNKFVEDNHFLPIEEFESSTKKIGIQTEVLDLDSFGDRTDTTFKQVTTYVGNGFKLEINEVYKNLEFYRSIETIKFKVTNTHGDSLVFSADPIEVIELGQVPVGSFSDYLVIEFGKGLFDDRGSSYYNTSIDFTLIHLTDLRYWRADEDIEWKHENKLIDGKYVQILRVYDSRPDDNRECYFTVVSDMYKTYFGFDTSFDGETLSDDELEDNLEFDITSEILFANHEIVTYSIKSSKGTYIKSMKPDRVLSLEDVFINKAFITEYMDCVLIEDFKHVDSTDIYYIGSELIDLCIEKGELNESDIDIHFLYKYEDYQLGYLDKDFIYITLNLGQVYNDKYLRLKINKKIPYSACRDQLTPLVLNALGPKFRD